MINRILIRIKVVQILYSYLISRNDFKIDPAPPGNASRERRFAYAVYLDMLMLIEELSGLRSVLPDRQVHAIDIDKRLRANVVGRALADNRMLKEALTQRGAQGINALSPILQGLSDRIVDSMAFRDYSKKKKHDLEQDVDFWALILETTILKDQELQQVLRQNPDFSISGLHHGIYAAISTLRSYSDTRAAYKNALADLQKSLDAASALYYALFILIAEITKEQEDRMELNKNKYLATADELNPNTRLIDNRLARFLAEDETLQALLDDIEPERPTWVDSPGLLGGLLDQILSSDLYAEYLALPETDWTTDCEFWRNAMRNIILPSDVLAEAIEDKSIFWNDDLSTMGTFVLKTLRKFANAGHGSVDMFLPPYKDEEDKEFGPELFRAAVEHREEYRELIDRFINADWDPDRLAFMDIVIMITAIAEIVRFPGIPVPVSLNEYIEIANSYSTRRSGPFINGILYSVIKTLVSEGRVLKPLDAPDPDYQKQS